MTHSRRGLLAAGLLPLLGGRPAVGASPTRQDAQPGADVVVVIADDMRDEDWQGLPQTRALVDGGGTFFPNFFTNTPTCSPSRVTALTGLYAHSHGVGDSDDGFAAFRRRNLARRAVFAALPPSHVGGFFGKFLNGYENTRYVLPGVDRWWASYDLDYTNFRVNLDGDVRRVPGYYTTEQEGRVVSFLRSTARPVLAYVAARAPHPPSVPLDRDRGAFAGAQVERTPALNEEDVSDKPASSRTGRTLSLRKLDQQHRRRLETMLAVDRMIVQIHAELVARGNPFYLFVTSDNGRLLGDHRLVNKGKPYDASTRISTAAFGPGFVAGAVDDRLVGMVDIAPTVAAVLGLDMPWVEGVDLRGDHDRDAILLEMPGKWVAMRTRGALYAEYKGGDREYYDYATDPFELDNLLADWSGREPRLSEAEQADLAARLSALRAP